MLKCRIETDDNGSDRLPDGSRYPRCNREVIKKVWFEERIDEESPGWSYYCKYHYQQHLDGKRFVTWKFVDLELSDYVSLVIKNKDD